MRYRTGLRTYLRYITRQPQSPQCKFLIFGRGRSGSTLLMSILNSNPLIYCEGELFQDPVLFPKQFLKCRAALAEKPIYGFKLLTYQVTQVLAIKNPANFLSDLHQMGFSILYLKRLNLLRQALSNIYARQTKEFHRSANHGFDLRPKITIDIGQLSNWLKGLERARSIEETSLSGLPFLPLTYDQHLYLPEAHQSTLDLLSEFFQIPSSIININLERNTPDQYIDFIENYEEFISFVRTTPYEAFL